MLRTGHPFTPLRAGKDRIKAKQYNQAMKDLDKVLRTLQRQGLSTSAGFALRTPKRSSAGNGTGGAKIFEVQAVVAGDGLYNCYEQEIDATRWADTTGLDRFIDKNTDTIAVLNLYESHVAPDYTRGLAKGDLIQAHSFTDDEDNSRWAGFPLEPTRRFKTTEVATANNHITCNVIKRDGTEAAAGADILYNIEVYFDICGGAATNGAIARLPSGTYLTAIHHQGKWWCTSILQTIDTAKGLEISSDKLAVNINTTELQFASGEVKTKLDACT